MSTTVKSKVSKGFVSVKDAAAFLGVCTVTVHRMIRDGELPSAIIGRRSRRVPREALEQYGEKRLTAGGRQ